MLVPTRHRKLIQNIFNSLEKTSRDRGYTNLRDDWCCFSENSMDGITTKVYYCMSINHPERYLVLSSQECKRGTKYRRSLWMLGIECRSAEFGGSILCCADGSTGDSPPILHRSAPSLWTRWGLPPKCRSLSLLCRLTTPVYLVDHCRQSSDS